MSIVYSVLNNDEYKQKKITAKTIFIDTIQQNTEIEVFRIYRKNSIRITKRTKINKNGFICPKFLREINVLKYLSNPPKHMRSHPGRKHVIRILDVYVDNGYLYFDMNVADGTLIDIQKKINIDILREKILIDISKALQYIHDMGFNHYDLSHKNIAYTESKLRKINFVLIDFGNAVHKERPMTIELSTCYAMSMEMIEATILLQDYQKSIENNDNNENEKKIKFIRKKLVHRKSDIWSIGSLSYYLHTYNLYAECDNFYENQYNILKNKSLEDFYLDGNSEIVEKTRYILNNNVDNRPITYFCKTSSKDQVLAICEEKIHDNNTKTTTQLKKNKLYMHNIIYDAIIENMSKINNKNFIVNNLDQQSYDDLYIHSYIIENKVKNIIVNKFNVKPVVVKIIVLWLVSHIFVNHVWTLDNIILYLTKMIGFNNEDHNDIITNISIEICNMVNWNFET